MDSSGDEYFNDNVMQPESPEDPISSDPNSKEENNETDVNETVAVENPTSVGALEAGTAVKQQLTMKVEIEELSEEHIKLYKDKLIELYGIDSSSSTSIDANQHTGAMEHISGYTMEQSTRFLAMAKIWKQKKEEKENEEKEEAEKCADLIFVDNITGHYGLYQVSSIGPGYLTATTFHRTLKEIGKVGIHPESMIESENGTSYRISSNMRELLLGDTIAVKELEFAGDKALVRKFCLFKRNILNNQKFTVGTSQKPVILGTGEVGTANLRSPMETPPFVSGFAYSGEIFFPVNWKNSKRNFHLPIAQPVILNFKKEDNLCKLEQFYGQKRCYKYTPENLDHLVVMGSSVITAARVGVVDSIRYSIESSRIKLDDEFIRLTVPSPATSKSWMAGMRFAIEGAGQAVITWSPENKNVAKIAARPIGNFNHASLMESPDRRRLVFQIPTERYCPPCIQPGFFEEMEDGSNGKRIIKTLFGGSAIGVNGEDSERSGFGNTLIGVEAVPFPECQPVPPMGKTYPMDTPQSTYIHRIVDGSPITVGNFPILSGKTTKVAIAALESAKAHPGTQHLIFVPDDQGAQVLVDRLLEIRGDSGIRALRMIGFKDWENLSIKEDTTLDFPALLRQFLQDVIDGKYDLDKETKESAKNYFGKETHEDTYWINLYFSLVSPQIIITKFLDISTYSPLHKLLDNVNTIQFDDADQIPQLDFIQTCIQFPHATYGLMGDSVKDRAYPLSMSAYQEKVAIGWLMDTSVKFKLFPIVTSNNVYGGVNPKIIDVIGNVYYKNRQLSGHAGTGSSKSPAVQILNNPMLWKEDAQTKEARDLGLLVKLVKKLAIPQNQIGVLCFTHKEIALLHQTFKNSEVYYGHYESFYGVQKDILIIWGAFESLKKDGLTMNLSTFLLTRGKQAVFILGSTKEMTNMKPDKNGVKWDALVQLVQANGGVHYAEKFIEC